MLQPNRCNFIDQGMADELAWNARFGIDLLLEWKNDQHQIDPLGDRLNPTRSPRPDLRADIVDDRNAETLGRLGQSKIEIGIIDQDQQIHSFPKHLNRESIRRPNRLQMDQNLKNSDDPQLRDIEEDFNPGAPHGIS